MRTLSHRCLLKPNVGAQICWELEQACSLHGGGVNKHKSDITAALRHLAAQVFIYSFTSIEREHTRSSWDQYRIANEQSCNTFTVKWKYCSLSSGVLTSLDMTELIACYLMYSQVSWWRRMWTPKQMQPLTIGQRSQLKNLPLCYVMLAKTDKCSHVTALNNLAINELLVMCWKVWFLFHDSKSVEHGEFSPLDSMWNAGYLF